MPESVGVTRTTSIMKVATVVILTIFVTVGAKSTLNHKLSEELRAVEQPFEDTPETKKTNVGNLENDVLTFENVKPSQKVDILKHIAGEVEQIDKATARIKRMAPSAGKMEIW